MARLLWRDGQGLEGAVDLGAMDVFIGRAMDCAIRTDDPMVSRRHARVFWQGGQHVIEDLGSANGIFVGENRVRAHPLHHGDAVRCGNLWVRYVNDQPGAMQGGPYGGPPPPGPFGGPPPPPGPFGGPPPPGPGAGPGPFMGVPPSNAPYGAPPPPAPFGGPPPPFGGPPPPVVGVPPGPPSPFGAPPPPVPQSAPPRGPMPGPAIGGPPPAAQAPRVAAAPAPAAASPLPSPASAVAPPAASGASDAEMKKLQRRVEQLQAELRMMRGGGDKAARMEELEKKAAELTDERDKLKQRIDELEGRISSEGKDAKVQRAGNVIRQADEAVSGLNDVLSEIRINLMAAEGEVEQWDRTLPKAQFELVREALRSCRGQIETAKELIQKLQSALEK